MTADQVIAGDARWSVEQSDALAWLQTLPDGCVRTCISSPPYFGLRDYGHAGQIGLEMKPSAFIGRLVEVFREVGRVLTPDGTLWVNIGDSYNGAGKTGGGKQGQHARHSAEAISSSYGVRHPHHNGFKPKDRMGIPHRLVFALQDDGWYWRDEIVWHKPNPMPESTKDRCTKAHEFIFMLSKSPGYFYDAAAIAERATGVSGGASFGKQRHDTTGTGAQSRTYDRPQQKRARELATQAGLTEAHFDAIRSVGITDTDKARVTQNGTGKNTLEVQRLADEAKAVLGGYYREFLMADTRNKRSVWTVPVNSVPGAHAAVFPPDLIRPCVLAGSAEGDIVADVFTGSGTTAIVSLECGRRFIGSELNPAYVAMASERLMRTTPAMFAL